MKRILISISVLAILLCPLFVGIHSANAQVNYDLDHNGVVDMEDIGLVVAAFRATPTDPRWNPLYDFDGSGRIDMRDIGAIVAQFGRTETPSFETPEFPMGPILGLAGFFVALGFFRFTKRSRITPQSGL